jgi:hypothetical protein
MRCVYKLSWVGLKLISAFYRFQESEREEAGVEEGIIGREFVLMRRKMY